MHAIFLAVALFAATDFPDVEENAVEDVEVIDADAEMEPISPDDDLAGEMPDAGPAVSAPKAPTPATPPKAENLPFIAGYHDSLWGDAKAAVQRNYPDDRPLVEKGDGQWMIRDACEGEDALIVYSFGEREQLRSVVCQFRKGLEDSRPDFALYQKVRRSLATQWGQPSNTNESPAPDSPSQAAEWTGKNGKAALVFSAEGSFVQLTVERKQP